MFTCDMFIHDMYQTVAPHLPNICQTYAKQMSNITKHKSIKNQTQTNDKPNMNQPSVNHGFWLLIHKMHDFSLSLAWYFPPFLERHRWLDFALMSTYVCVSYVFYLMFHLCFVYLIHCNLCVIYCYLCTMHGYLSVTHSDLSVMQSYLNVQ